MGSADRRKVLVGRHLFTSIPGQGAAQLLGQFSYTPGKGEPRHGTPRVLDLQRDIAELNWPCTVNTTGNLELLRMLRRLTAVVVIWMSLLGAAFPALACSLAASTADCCGQPGTSSPCAGGAGFSQLPDVTTALCCSSGHAASASVAIDSRGASHERDQHPSSPDPVVLIAWYASWSAPVPEPLITLSLSRSPPSAAAPTYLQTARLRL
jgi:hypothetical protein